MPVFVGALSPFAAVAALAVLGLLIGSFLNVVIYRVPLMMERAYAVDMQLSLEAERPGAGSPFNLSVPRSACPTCGHVIRWYENIPVLSYLALRGRCASCKTKISLRYPAVELATAGLFAYCAWRWGLSWTALSWAGFGASLFALAAIDWDTTLLPDDITLPLIWAGFIGALLGLTGTPLANAVVGAMAGYLSLWLLFHVTLYITGAEAMGYGDFKLFAAIGAWLGWTAMPMVILIASVTAGAVGVALKMRGRLQDGAMPFGPFLGIGALTVLVLGETSLARWIGF